ncbi:MAG: hypothetical protein JEZ07_07165 [Phycisphaerae bacterium]|nr:hypothetical protein [Phycisphaerae bacterium]
MFWIIATIIGLICAIIARSKGRSVIGWFLIGFFLGLIGLIIMLVVSNKKDEKQKHEQLQNEQRRLHEQLRQERLKNEQFRKHAQSRLDAHDNVLELDTRQTSTGMDNEVLQLLDDRHRQPEIEQEPLQHESDEDDDRLASNDPYNVY